MLRAKIMPNVLWLGTMLLVFAGVALWAVVWIVGGLTTEKEVLVAFVSGGAFVLLISVILTTTGAVSGVLGNLTTEGPPPTVPASTHEKTLDKIPDKS